MTGYFRRLGPARFDPTAFVGGGWNPAEQHIAPALGLLAHLVELDHAERGGVLTLARATYDILGTIPMEAIDTSVRVIRPGRTIELVEATLSHGGRPALVLRAWMLQPSDTSAAAGSELPAVPGPEDVAAWDPGSIWPGGFVRSVEVRRREMEPGRAVVWVRTPASIIESEGASDTARVLGLVDISNGMTPRVDPQSMGFANVDLTAHLFTAPRGEWVGFDTTVSFGASGVGLTHSTLHDIHGPIGTVSQSLTLRPR